MIKLLLEPVNLLILDEPTNHLDMSTKDVLKRAIEAFDGTVIIVSHDREFLDGLVSKVYEFGGGKVTEHLGGIYDFLQKRKIESLVELEKKRVEVVEEKPKEVSDNKLSYMERKEIQRKIRQFQNCVNDAEKRIAKIEEQIAEVEKVLATPEGFSNIDLCQKHGELNRELGIIMEYWEEQCENLERAKSELED